MSDIIRVTKVFHFEAAHALDGYQGKCKDIHGHSYELQVTVKGICNSKIDASDCGMVIDFGDLKNILKTKVDPLFDHRLILRKDSRFKGIEKGNKTVRYVDYQPTCENMLVEIVGIIKPLLSKELQLTKVFLRETHSSFAAWYLSDNE